MFTLSPSGGVQSASGTAFVIGTAITLVAGTIVIRSGQLTRLRLPSGPARPVMAGLAAAIVMTVGAIAAPAGSQTFIYFQF